jgi:hypothetical protein
LSFFWAAWALILLFCLCHCLRQSHSVELVLGKKSHPKFSICLCWIQVINHYPGMKLPFGPLFLDKTE